MNLLEAFETVEAPRASRSAAQENEAWGVIVGFARRWADSNNLRGLRQDALSLTLTNLASQVQLGTGPLATIRRAPGRGGSELARVSGFLRRCLSNQLRSLLRERRRELLIEPSAAQERRASESDESSDEPPEFDAGEHRALFRSLCERGLGARLETMQPRYRAPALQAWNDYWSVRFGGRAFTELVALEAALSENARVASKTLDNRIYKRHERARQYVAEGLGELEGLSEPEQKAADSIREWLGSDDASCQTPGAAASSGKRLP